MVCYGANFRLLSWCPSGPKISQKLGYPPGILFGQVLGNSLGFRLERLRQTDCSGIRIQTQANTRLFSCFLLRNTMACIRLLLRYSYGDSDKSKATVAYSNSGKHWPSVIKN